MQTIVRVVQLDADRVMVKRSDYALTGLSQAEFALMADGSWRRVGTGEPYPEECILTVQKVGAHA